MSVPHEGEVFAKLIHHIEEAQEAAAMLAHLQHDLSPKLARNWLAVSENFKNIKRAVTSIATKRMH